MTCIRFSPLCVLLFLLIPTAIAQDQPLDTTAENARVFRGEGGQPLTPASQAAPAAVVGQFLASQGRGQQTVASLVVAAENRVERTGMTHLRFRQEIDGLEVYGTYVKATVNGDGELVHMIEALADSPPAGLVTATVSSRQALDAVVSRLYPGQANGLAEAGTSGNTTEFSHDGFFHRNPTVTRVAVAMASGAMQQGFLVETWTNQDNLLHHTLVGANGRILKIELRTNADSYNIFPDHPGNSAQTVTAGPGAGNTESPSGWLFSGNHRTIEIAGNNAHAYLDGNNNNAPDAGGSTVSDGNFLAAANLSQQPEVGDNPAAAVQNLFYLNNVIHDKLYQHGFVEGAGNFQENNFGNGGVGSDSVNAEAQDGGGTNNANFATPADGSNPRMQMYLWTQTSPKRDGSLDSDIPWHEYGHGLTWRMIGSMSGCMSGAIGEGMSDGLAILVNDDDTVGEYSFNNANGIRSAPYTNYCNSRTYGDLSGQSVHFDGEIYAAAIWKLWKLFQTNGISQDTLLDYIVGGMNFTPAGPDYEAMRDGILQASPNAAHDCLIWEAFAECGIGEGANGRVQGGGPFGGGRCRVNESFTVPAACSSCTPVAEVCDNGVDDDCDLAVDCADADCDADPACDSCTISENPEVSCSDGVDNDCDGLFDLDDPDCQGDECVNPGGLPVGQSCNADSECCSNKCRGRPGGKTCK